MSASLFRSRLGRKLAPLSTLRTPGDVALFVRVVGVATVVPLLVRLPLPRLASLLSAAGRGRRHPFELSTSECERIVRCVDAAQRVGSPLVRSGCLTRSMTLYWFLRRAGAEVELCFGTGRVDDDFAGHCWLVRDGRPYLEAGGAAPRFEAIYRIPTRP